VLRHPQPNKGVPCNSAIYDDFLLGGLRLHYYYLIVIFLYYQKCAKTHLRQCRNSKTSSGEDPGQADPRFKVGGGERLMRREGRRVYAGKGKEGRALAPKT